MKQYALFGNPVEHSISPKMHNSVFKALNINAVYSKHKLIDPNELKPLFKKLNLHGANITVPHKEVAYTTCNSIQGVAKEIKAVNTIIENDDNLIGYNTDAPGFLMAIEEFLPLKNALILGAGGTARAIACALIHQGLHVSLVNRSKNRLNNFNDIDIQTSTWDTFQVKNFDIIINTTSAGLDDNSLPMPLELLMPTIKNAKCAFDVIYHKATPFLNMCKQKSLTCKDGENMLLYQGVLAFNIFTNGQFDQKTITNIMLQAFTS